MPRLSPQHRFLLRGSALLVALLIFWWFFLSAPMLAILRTTVEITGGLFFGGSSADLMRETPAGDWAFHVPIEAIIPAAPPQPASAIHSVDFDLARKDVNAFTFSLPVFWAIMLAAPNLHRNLRTLALGTAVMAVIELLLLLLLIEINAGLATHAQGDIEKWLLRVGEYLVVTVIPYAAPFVLAISVHRDLRRQMLVWVTESPVPAAAPAPPAKRRSRTAK
jgi:hypothetical protein